MAHPDEQEAIDVQPADNDAAAIDAFDAMADDEEQPVTEDEDEPQDDEPEGEDVDLEEEPETPAIPAPVSFNPDEKAAFAQLPPELQTSVAAIEARRNADVQKATTKAAEAERNAIADAERQLSEIQRGYAAELAQYAQAFEPQEPDYALLATDPQAFAHQMAMYKAGQAHADGLRKQAADAQRQASELETQNKQRWEAEQMQILTREIPEWSDPAKRSELVGNLMTVGLELGFTQEQLSNVDAAEVLALRQIAKDRADAAKYRDLVSRKMAGVRAAKGKPAPITARPGAAQPKGSGQRRAMQEATSRLKQTGSDADAMAAFEAMGL